MVVKMKVDNERGGGSQICPYCETRRYYSYGKTHTCRACGEKFSHSNEGSYRERVGKPIVIKNPL